MKILTFLSFAFLTNTVFAQDLAERITKAQGGDFEAMLDVGLAYLGDDDKANNLDGIKWIEMACLNGSPKAYYNLGTIFQDGKGVEKDINKALLNLTVAAELGEIRAMNRLAGLYYVGEEVPSNDILAVKWALCAAELGSKSAQDNVQKMMNSVVKSHQALGANAAVAWLKSRSTKQGEEEK